jgi:hypothetical protein
MILKKDQVIGNDMWQYNLPEDEEGEVFCGWINLNEDGRSQYFTCKPGDYIMHPKKFRDVDNINNITQNAKGTDIEVPPGHWICFQQSLLHKTKSRIQENDDIRLHTAFRVRTNDKNVIDYQSTIDTQGVPLLASLKKAELYNDKRDSSYRDTTINPWAINTFIPEVFEKKTIVTDLGDMDIETTEIFLGPTMKSLVDMSLPLYPEYTTEERHIMTLPIRLKHNQPDLNTLNMCK